VESYADVASLRQMRLKFMGAIGETEIPGQVQQACVLEYRPRQIIAIAN
jgi:hypothetical protein